MPGPRDAGHARGHIDRVTENIVFVFDDLAEVDPSTNGQLGTGQQFQVADLGLRHPCRRHRAVRRGEAAHEFVADFLDDDTPVCLDDGLQFAKALIDDLFGTFIAKLFIHLGAAADVGKEDGTAGFLHAGNGS